MGPPCEILKLRRVLSWITWGMAIVIIVLMFCWYTTENTIEHMLSREGVTTMDTPFFLQNTPTASECTDRGE